MSIFHCKLIPWRKLSKLGKQISLLSFVLAGLCVTLLVMSVSYFIGLPDAAPDGDDQAGALLLAAQIMPTSSPIVNSSLPIAGSTATPRPVVLQDVDGYSIIAKLSIEKISLELPIIGETSDEALKVAPRLFSGPATPADDGNMVLTAHNNKDDSQFGRLNELEKGDTVTLMDKWGDTFSYEVYDIETITPDNVAALEEYEGERALALLTCSSNGNRRLLLRCRMV